MSNIFRASKYAGELRQHLAVFRDDGRWSLRVHFGLIESRGANLVQVEFIEQVDRTADGILVVEDLD